MKNRIKLIPLLVVIVMLFLSVPAFGAETANGTYLPSSFSYTGGTGRVTISCLGVTIEGESAIAEIEFGSGSYDYIKIGETKYKGNIADGKSRFNIPVNLNGDTLLVADTTAMSKPHEIEYKFHIELNQNTDSKMDKKIIVFTVIMILVLGAGVSIVYQKKHAQKKKGE